MSLIVHHLNHSRSQRLLWLLEELELPYEIHFYERDKSTMLAPPELKKVHPLGKSPVVTDGKLVLAESGAIIETLVETYGEGKGLKPAAGTDEKPSVTLAPAPAARAGVGVVSAGTPKKVSAAAPIAAGSAGRSARRSASDLPGTGLSLLSSISSNSVRPARGQNLVYSGSALRPRRAAIAGKPARNVKCLMTSYDGFRQKFVPCAFAPPRCPDFRAASPAHRRSLRDCQGRIACR